jgi:DnaD/phage-associated family protein
MSPFKGFADGKTARVGIPAAFFSEVLPGMDDVLEIKLSLWILRLLDAQDGPVPYVRWSDVLESKEMQEFSGSNANGSVVNLEPALNAAVQRGVFLLATDKQEKLIFLNSPRGRAAVAALQKGSWQPGRDRALAPIVANDRPNIFELYEANIGPLTPILAQTLEEAENEYSAEWIEEALKLAVKKNVRNWSYVEAILRSWKEKGRGETDQRNDQENPRRYIEGDLADYIKH